MTAREFALATDLADACRCEWRSGKIVDRCYSHRVLEERVEALLREAEATGRNAALEEVTEAVNRAIAANREAEAPQEPGA